MTVISIERWNSIAKSRSVIKGRKVAVVIAIAVWLFAALVSLPTLIEYKAESLDTSDEFGNITIHMVCHQSISRSYTVGNGYMTLFVSYIFPQVIIYTNYIRLGYFIYVKSRVKVSEGGQSTSKNFKAKIRVIHMLVTIATLFSVSWLPYFVIQLITVRYARHTHHRFF